MSYHRLHHLLILVQVKSIPIHQQKEIKEKQVMLQHLVKFWKVAGNLSAPPPRI